MYFRRGYEMAQYLTQFWALKAIQIPGEALFGFLEVDALLTSVKNSA
jgi:hypothetical protein